MLIKMSVVSAIVEMHATTISQKTINGSFPQPKCKEAKIYKWEKQEIIDWVNSLERTIVSMYESNKSLGQIRLATKSSTQRVNKIIAKLKAKRNSERPKINVFKVFLTVSANLTNNREIV